MSFFNDKGASAGGSWGGFLKNAMATVENRLDKALDFPTAQSSSGDTESYVDPETGILVTTRKQMPEVSPLPKFDTAGEKITSTSTSTNTSTPTSNSSKQRRPQEDLAARLAKAVGDKSKPRKSTEVSSESSSRSRTPSLDVARNDLSIDAPLEDVNAGITAQRDLQGKSSPDSSGNTADASANAAQGPIAIMKPSDQQDEKQGSDDDVNAESTELDIASKVVTSEPDTSTSSNLETRAITEQSASQSSTETDGGNVEYSQPPTQQEADLNKVLRQRERQLESAMEANAILNNQINDLNKALQKKEVEYESRANETATKMSSQSAEVQSLRGELEALRSGQSNPQQGTTALQKIVDQLRAQVKQKEEQVTGLMEEGEKLSKNELKHMTTIKKLRAEKTENAKQISELQKKIEKSSQDQVDANARMLKSQETEKRLQENVRNLNTTILAQQKELEKLSATCKTLQRQLNESQQALEKANEDSKRYQIEAQKANDAAVQDAMLQERTEKQRLSEELEKLRQSSRTEVDDLERQLLELRRRFEQQEQQVANNEDRLRDEIAYLQKRLQAAEQNAEQHANGLDEATGSLIQQINALQAQHDEAVHRAEVAEKKLDNALKSYQANLESETTEKFHISQRLDDLLRQQSDMQNMLEKERSRNASLTQSLNDLQLVDLERKESLAQQEFAITQMKEATQRDLEQLREKLEAEFQLRLENERKAWTSNVPLANALDATNLKHDVDEQKPLISSPIQDTSSSNSLEKQLLGNLSPNKAASVSSRSSLDTDLQTVNGTKGSPMSFDRMQSSLRQLEGQNQYLSKQIQTLTQSRTELQDELVQMTREMEKRNTQIEELLASDKEHKDLAKRYHAALEMLGERTEEANELRADIQDVKEMYRHQIVELVATIDKLRQP